MMFGYELTVIFLMLVVNAFFASYEMALASVSRARLAVLCQQKKKGADQAVYMKERMEASLAVIQLGITLAGALAAATGGAGVQEYFTPYLIDVLRVPESYAEILAIMCLVIPLSAFTIIFAELVPKMVALENKEWVCLSLSPFMKAIALMADPVVSLFERVIKGIMGFGSKRFKQGQVSPDKLQGLHELRAAVAMARTSRLMGAHEEKIVLSAAQLSMRKVSDIMLHASDISTLPVSSSLADALIKAHLDMHTRFPVYENDPQTIVGYVNFKDIVNALKVNPVNPTIRGIMRPIKRVSAEAALSDTLSEMIREKVHIAVVVSEEQKVAGMITLEDIMEELVGEIEDEFDRIPAHIHPYGANWIMGGGVPMGVVFKTVQTFIPEEAAKTKLQPMADWVYEKLGRSPEPGEVMERDGLKITARKLRRKKIYEAIVGSSANDF